MKKRFLALLLVVCLLAACIPVASAYSNVAPWAKESVDGMYQLGFLPQSLNSADMTRRITRGEMCKIAVAVFNQLMGTPDVGPHSTDHFDDTSDPDICYAFEQGIVSGYGDGRFGPNEPLTRQDFIKITFNMIDMPAMMRFRSGKLPLLPGSPGSISESRSPLCEMTRRRSAFCCR